MNDLDSLTNACRLLSDRRTWWSRLDVDISNSLLIRAKETFSTHSTRRPLLFLPMPQKQNDQLHNQEETIARDGQKLQGHILLEISSEHRR